MNKALFRGFSVISIISVLLLLCGCSQIGEKDMSMSVIYAILAVISLLLLVLCCNYLKKTDLWYILLFASVFIVNIGYFALSISKTLEEALLANRIAYLGSVCLPLSMLRIIMNTAKLNCKKWISVVLFIISGIVFIVAASPGYLDIYYKEVTLTVVNGVTVLEKVYGPWHKLYLVYLTMYFAGILGVIIYAIVKKRVGNAINIVILFMAVFVNIGVWLMEQLIDIDFEFLSVSYIISEMFLLSVHYLLRQNEISVPVQEQAQEEPLTEQASVQEAEESTPADSEDVEKYRFLSEQVAILTPTEKVIFDYYLEGKSTKEVLSLMNIKENTLKYHNKNIYSKLGVSSKKELIRIASMND